MILDGINFKWHTILLHILRTVLLSANIVFFKTVLLASTKICDNDQLEGQGSLQVK